MAVPIRSVKFWLNAFIPRDIPGYTRLVPGGPHAGKTMIPGPFRPSFPTTGSTSVHVELSNCYLTDQRGFSNEIHAKSRMHSEFKVDVSGPTLIPVMTQWHNCDFTTECECRKGNVECYKKGNTNRMKFELLTGLTRGLIIVRMECAANNPCSPPSRFFGDIDYTGNITINVEQRSLEFDGKIDQFPAFEAYATINDGAGVPLFRIPPPGGHSVMNLPGRANRPVRCRLVDRNGDGIFETF